MSRDVTRKHLELRSRVLSEGTSTFCVLRSPCLYMGPASSWEQANELARSYAYSNPGDTFRAEERRSLNGVVAVARCREWASYGVMRMEDYRHGA